MNDHSGESAWPEERAAGWLARAAALERQLQPVAEALFERAALRPGEHVLDVGVGAGPTTTAAHRAVQPGGRITGIDISPAMIAAARARPDADGIEWVVGDAGGHRFPPESFDVVISRFGLMFFADPVAAFRGLRAATRPGGRLVAAVWCRRDATGLFEIPHTVATTTLHRLGVEYTALAPDALAFSLGEPEVVRRTLGAAGWAGVAAVADNRRLYLGAFDAVDQVAEEMVSFGPLARLLEDQPDEVRAEVRAALVADLEHRREPDGIWLPSGFLLISARRR